jgi:hypothetical protein
MNIDLIEGDYLKIAGVNTKITQQQVDDIQNSLLTYTPIALNDTWFTDFLFTQFIDNDTGLGKYKKGDITIFFSPIRLVAEISYCEQIIATVDCVHHVQNVVKKQNGEMLTK